MRGGPHIVAWSISQAAMIIPFLSAWLAFRKESCSVPMSLLADHPNVHFHYLRSGIGTVAVEMH